MSENQFVKVKRRGIIGRLVQFLGDVKPVVEPKFPYAPLT
jgi:hypothetical protein